MVLLYSTMAFSMQASSSPQRSAIFIMSFIVGSSFLWTLATFACFLSIAAFCSPSSTRIEESGCSASALIGTIMVSVRLTRHSAGSDLSEFLPTAEYS
jgi:hypothetical protein